MLKNQKDHFFRLKISAVVNSIAISLLFGGCGLKLSATDESKQATADSSVNLKKPPQGFLTQDALKKPSNVFEANSESLDGDIQDNYVFFPSLADSDTSSSSSEDEEMNTACQEEKANNLPVSYNNQWLSYEGEIDLISCINKINGRPQTKNHKMRLFYAFFLHGYSGDGSDFKGKKLGEVSDVFKKNALPPSDDPIPTGQIIQFQIDEEFVPINGSESATEKISLIGYTGGANGGACIGEAQGDTETIFDCLTISKYLNQYSKFVFENVTGSSKGPHFSSGSIKFEINDWIGKMVYKGKSINPEWDATKNGESAKGTLKAKK